jgi:hypothetical protein
MKKVYVSFIALICAVASFGQVKYFSKATATDFNDVNTWGTAADGTGTSPTSIMSTDTFAIANGALLNLTADAAIAKLQINAGELTVAANSLTISHAGSLKNSQLSIAVNSRLRVTGGAVNLNGQFTMVSGAKFAQSGGTITVDGNDAGVAANSVVTNTVQLFSVVASDLQLTAGTIVIVDPSVGTGTYALNASCAVATNSSPNHTIQYGDGVSTDAGTTNGFYTYFFTGSSYLILGNVIANGGSSTNRHVLTLGNHGILGNLTVNANSEYRLATTHYIKGNVINNGILTVTSTMGFADYSNATISTVITPQSVSGGGIFRNLATAPTANVNGFYSANTSSTGVTVNPTTNIASQPANTFSVSGTINFAANGARITMSSGMFVSGISTPTAGTLTLAAGVNAGFSAGTKFGRWFTATATGTAITVGTDPTSNTSRFPFITSQATGSQTRSIFTTRTTPSSAGGILAVTFANPGGTTPVTIADGAYTVNTRSNDNWVITSEQGTPTSAASLGVYIIAPGIYGVTPPDNTSRVTLANAVTGTFNNGTTTPGAYRTAITPANFLNTYYMGINLPACVAPGPITFSSITTTSANVSFAGPGSSFIVEYGPVGFTPGTGATAGGGTIVTGTASPIALTGLTPLTSYDVYVRQDCSASSNGFSLNSAKVNLVTTNYCVPSAINSPTPSWISVFNTTGGVSNITHSASVVTPGGFAELSQTNIVSNYIGQTTNFTLTSGGPTVGNAIWVDWNNNFSFETTERVFVTTGYGTTVTGTIAIPAGQADGNYKMRVHSDFNNSGPSNPCGAIARGEFKDFTFAVVSAPSCLPPSALTNSAITTTSANHNWTAPTPAPSVGYEWAVTTSATPPASGTAVTGTTASSTGLTPNTTYYLHVRSDCGAGVFSNWATSTSFYTGYCLASSTNSTPSWISAFSTTGGVTNITHTAAAAAAGGYANLTNLVVSNYLGQPTSFSITSGGPTVGNAIWVDWNSNLVFETTERVFVTTGYGTTVTGSIAIPAAQANGSYRMRVITDYNNSAPSNPCGLITQGEYKDFTFSVVDAPSCIAPTTLTNSAVTSTSASHTWTAPSPAPGVGYEWAVTTSVTPPASGTAVTGITASSTGLTPNTTYYLHVRSDCGAGVFSNWATSTSFYTGYCVFAGTNTSSYFDAFNTTGGTTNITNNASGYSTNGYGDFTTQKVTQLQGGTVNFAGTLVIGDEGVAIWVDFNDNLTFETTERLYNSGTYLTTLSGSFTIPLSAPVGNHRMRIVMDYNSTSPSPCSLSSGRGEAEDYTLEVVAAPPCAGPINGGIATSSNSVLCGSGTTTLNATGISAGIGLSYQWQSSPAGANTFTDITGATTINYTTAAITVSTDFRLVVTCANGPVSGNSTIATTIISGAPANDDCANAVTLVHSTSPITCNNVAGTTACATQSSETSGCFSSSQDDDVWYSFTATSSVVKINLTGITLVNGTLPTSMGYALITGCGVADGGLCGNTVITGGSSSFTVFGLTVGTEYKIRILTFGTGGRVNFNICLTVPSITPGTNNACTTGSTLTITSANANVWSPLFDANANLIAEINPNGNILGVVTPSVYVSNNATLRNSPALQSYMNRNIAITVATPPTNPVSVRLYFTNAEKAALDAAVPSANDRSDIVLTKEPGGCTPASLSNGILLNQTGTNNGAYGNDHYVETSVTSFSNFFLHKGASVLPIAVDYIKGTKVQAGNLIDWKVNCTSAPSIVIELERSGDARRFATIKTEAATAVRCLQAFNHIDAQPLGGMNYYRLKITEPSGAFKYSSIVAILNKDKGFEIASLVPNPVKDVATISLASAKASKVEIAIADVVGRVLVKQSSSVIAGNNNINMNFATLAAGTYTVIATNAEGEVKTIRFVKY